ncbi:hypothetical protein LK08_31505 [Streptomyces sp. MUSC 125]|uniref:WXG100-like domain-containing protein n=1 Tax=Streptomyces sp. MUSC 125 TaxID=1428624 RepID=UPI00057E10DB|nr:hypothetical protein [Streptomyces sp. MUSC 125]KIE23126.1 hypothetical protein LK08_31505 [Streptomyces sp. MUSC 125]
MSAADKAKQIVQDMTGMWWPDADESGLRDAAKAWRHFADDLEDVTAAANKTARGIITHNKGEAISAFDDPYWRRYYYEGHGWLQDMIDGARDIAKALDQYADTVHHAVKKLEHERTQGLRSPTPRSRHAKRLPRPHRIPESLRARTARAPVQGHH